MQEPSDAAESESDPYEPPETPGEVVVEPRPVEGPKHSLTSLSFLGLVFAQFLGSWNDNMFRWISTPLAISLLMQGQVVGGGKAQALAGDTESFVLSVGLASFVIPFIVFATLAGYLADRFSKRTVVIGCKLAELVIMVLGIASIAIGNVTLMFVVLFLMGTHSALYMPAKSGSLPEMLKPEDLSAANGIMGLSTVLAAVCGTVAAGVLYDATQGNNMVRLWVCSLSLFTIAAVGLAFSLFITPLPAANPQRKFPYNFALDTYRDLRLLCSHSSLLRVALGIAFFWSLASLAQVNVQTLVVTELQKAQTDVSIALGIMALGVGLGSILAGYLSGGKVELGLVPIGATGIVCSSVALYFAPQSYHLWMALLGISAGLFDVPLEAFLQHRSPQASRGSILAATNLLTFLGMLSVSGLFYVLHGQWHLSPTTIFLLAGLTTIPVLIYVMVLIPWATVRLVVWLLTHTIYNVRVHGQENLPDGGALLVPNHVSWADGLFLLMTSSRPIRMIAYADYVQKWPINWLARFMKVIPIKGNHKAIRNALDTARQAVLDGELVCIFAEGVLTRSGQLQTFQRGFMKIVEGTHVPVVPVYLDELWGSIFSYKGGRFFWKLPRQWPYPVSILYGKPLPHPDHVSEVRRAVEQLGVDAVEYRKSRERLLPRVMLRTCRRQMFRTKIADSTGDELSGGSVLMRSLILGRLLRREVLAKDEKMVGVLLPPSNGAVLVNAALTLLKRVSVNLNYTVASDVLNSCIKQAGIKHLLTSRKVMEKLDLKIDCELIYLEDLKPRVGLFDKIAGAFGAYVTPAFILERYLGLTSVKPDDLMTIIFTSGSTGEPKGVMLSYQNIGSNVRAMDQAVDLDADDTILGVLPFFHSFGYTTTLWATLTLSLKGVFHYSPLDARQVGKLAQKYKATVLLTAPTFLRSYLRRCEKEELASLELVIVGAEKLPADLSQAFQDKIGRAPFEGYGATELSPLVSCNLPNVDAKNPDILEVNNKAGTVGRPLPGVAAKIVHPETWQDLDVDQEGLLLVKGPNVMLGYLNKPEATAEKIKDGWYITGDIALIDRDGFIKITGRQSRFSKIGGEMVPHIKIEETIATLIGAKEELLAVVTAVPDEKKGERIVVLHKPLEKSVDDICKGLSEAGLPNLWIPSADSFIEVPEIPLLGSGKVALSKVKELALEKFAPAKAAAAGK